MVVSHPEKLNVATSAPRPPEQARPQVTPSLRKAMPSSRPSVWLVAAALKALISASRAVTQAIVDIAHHERRLTVIGSSPQRPVSIHGADVRRFVE